MRASLRLGLYAFMAGLSLAPVVASAQQAPAATNTPATDAVGPRELQNFSLSGRVTQQAEPAPTAPAATTTRSPTPREQAGATTPSSAGTATRERETAAKASKPADPIERTRGTSEPAPALSLDLPQAPTAASSTPSPQPSFSPDPEPDLGTTPLTPEHRAPFWPWLLAALALGAAGAWFLRHRRHSREAFVGGASVDAYLAPEPRAEPTPSPVPAPSPPKPAGLVSSGLRPWIDIEFVPIRCLVDDEKVTFEFAINLLNSGGALARDVLIEASVYNAGPSQERDIATFFNQTSGPGERIPVIPPLQRYAVQSALVAPRTNIQAFELGGRQLFVPLIAFNVSYRTSNREARTSAAFMLGRESNGEKLGPLRLDLGRRAFTGLGARALPISVRK